MANFKTVLITGASSGIGWATAIEAVKKGHQVHLMARRIDKLRDLQAICEAIKPGSAKIYQVDLMSIDQVADTLDSILNSNQIDIVINNAGVGLMQPLASTTHQEMVNIFKVNVISLMYISKRLASHMLKANQGHIINIGSMAGKVATANSSVYSASKAAVIAFSNALRQELRSSDLIVTTVNLGPVDTHFFDHLSGSESYLSRVQNYILQEDEVAKKIVNIFMKRKRELNLPWLLSIGEKFYRLFPGLAEAFVSRNFSK